MKGDTCSFSPPGDKILHNILMKKLHMLTSFALLMFTSEGNSLGLMRTPVVGASIGHIPKVMKYLRNLLLAGHISLILLLNQVMDGCSYWDSQTVPP
jgi:hypothetical protein